MDETSQPMDADIAASLNLIPFRINDVGARAAARSLEGTCQTTITGLGSWLCTIKEGKHTTVRCNGTCDPPPDTTLTMSPETFLGLVRQDDGMNAETAIRTGLLTISGDWELALAIVGSLPEERGA
jgi:hypothetical protein